MSLFTREETRDIGWPDVFGTDSAGPIGPATRIAAVYGAVSLIADLFSILPMKVIEERVAGQPEPVSTPLWLADPDPFLDQSAWRYQLTTSLKLRGNAYGIVDPGRRYLRWMHPDWVGVDESNPLAPRYFVNGQEQIPVKLGGNLLHVREFVQPGSVMGLSPIANFRDLWESAQLAAGYGRKWFKEASIPPAILSTTEKRLGPDKLREARDDFIAATAEGKPVALPGEWNWQKISIAPQEAQFLETIEANATQIATIFRVSAEDIGGKAGSSRTYSNREMDQELLNVRTLMPLGQRAGEAFAQLLPSGQSVMFEYDYLAQPGQLEAARAEGEELRNGTLTLPEARRNRGRKPLTPAEVQDWQDHYTTTKTLSESIAESITKEA